MEPSRERDGELPDSFQSLLVRRSLLLRLVRTLGAPLSMALALLLCGAPEQ